MEPSPADGGAPDAADAALPPLDAGPTLTHRVQARRAGDGVGRIVSSPAGIDCGDRCAEDFAAGAALTLAVEAAPGSRFTGWTAGPCAGRSGPCAITVDGDLSMEAAIELERWPLSLRVDGAGRVTSEPAGIDCGAACEATYPDGTFVLLTAAPESGRRFDRWSGACVGAGACLVEMRAARAATAHFVEESRPLQVRVLGSGSGAVLSTPAGIDCGRACRADFPYGAFVTLEPRAAPTSRFAGWSGACLGTAPCVVHLTEARLVMASFEIVPRQLAVATEGPGQGTIRSQPAGVDCGADCDHAFPHGTQVSLTAAPASPASAFAGWSGACAGSGPCVLSMDADRSASARFVWVERNLSVARVGAGAGAVLSAPAGVDCGADCDHVFRHGTQVTLTATVDASSSVFRGWSGACSGLGPCALDMTADRAVTADVGLLSRPLDVAVTGPGRVTSAPLGLDCGASCSAGFPHGTLVTLVAAPEAGGAFTGWGGACSGTGPCTVDMTAARRVTAGFRLLDRTLTVSTVGAGAVTSAPGGIDCNDDCTEPYPHGTTVTLTAAPAPTGRFLGWSGACSGTGPCVLPMTADASVQARFAEVDHPLTVSASGTGLGNVISAPGGIDCGPDCSEPYRHGTAVTLMAEPEIGSVFTSWAGACSGSGPCVVDMNQAQTVTARFDPGFTPVLLSQTDKSPDHYLVLTPDQLGAFHFGLDLGGVRTRRGIRPGSGIFYFEAFQPPGHWLPQMAAYGVATRAVALNEYPGGTPYGVSVELGGVVSALGQYITRIDGDSRAVGFVADYRGTNPTVYVIGLINGNPALASTHTLTAVTEPLYIMIAGRRRALQEQEHINPGNDIVNFPFQYDPEAVLATAGVSLGAPITLGWGQSHAEPFNAPPTLTVSQDVTIPLGATTTVTASALDLEEGDLTATVRWEDLATPYGDRTAHTGASWAFRPSEIGIHRLRATVTDTGNKQASEIVEITVTGTVAQHPVVRLVPDATSGAGIVLRGDGLAARYTANQKSGIRANQGLYQGFQYFEIHREIPPINMGGGLVTGTGFLNPYRFQDVPPSMSINSFGGVWQNYMLKAHYRIESSYYGFAVDYRGVNPIVHVVALDASGRPTVADTVHMFNLFTPVYPMLYGNPTGSPAGMFDNSINFGATPFYYDPVPALQAAGVDLTGFELGWGDANTP